ncbi:putative apyrase 5 [Zea mays]|uniref:Putative apyrase 5 n=1 Tax=Zea mays TaxID=4577 RepID=A0A1D6K4E5_MAIZE|nr:putative apyrase 5 [Zea mays]
MPDPTTKLPSPRPRRRRRLFSLCLGTALLALIVSALVHVVAQPPGPAPASARFSVIIDGGSTGTRAHNAAQDSFHEMLRSRGSFKNGTLADPCAPRGYSRNEGASRSTLENQYVNNGTGNFTECISSSQLLLQKGKEKCQYQQCHLGSTFVPELRGYFLGTENLYFTSKFFGLKKSSSLSDFMFAGEQFCNQHLSSLRKRHPNRSDEDFSRYCFSMAYIVALLHDSLGVPLDDKRQAYSARHSEIYSQVI